MIGPWSVHDRSIEYDKSGKRNRIVGSIEFSCSKMGQEHIRRKGSLNSELKVQECESKLQGPSSRSPRITLTKLWNELSSWSSKEKYNMLPQSKYRARISTDEIRLRFIYPWAVYFEGPPSFILGEWGEWGSEESGGWGAKNWRTLLFQSTIDIHIRNTRKIATKLRRLALCTCITFANVPRVCKIRWKIN